MLKNTKYYDIVYDIIDVNNDNNKLNTIENNMTPVNTVRKYCEIKGGEYKDNYKDLEIITTDLLEQVNIDIEKKIEMTE